MKKVAVYLAGNIQKDHEKDCKISWTASDRQILQDLCPDIEFTFLNPAIRQDDLSDQKSVIGRDLLQVYLSDFVLIDIREKRGIGVGAEMMWAKVHKIPLIALSPIDSHYRKTKTALLGIEVEGWTHPFVEGLCDVIAHDLSEIAKAIRDNVSARDLSYMKETMVYYYENQFSQDIEMQKLLEADPRLKKKINENLLALLSADA